MSRVAIMVERPSSPQQRVTVEVAQRVHDYWLVVPWETTSALELFALSARNEADLIIQLPTGIVHLVGFFDVPETGFKLVVKNSNNDLEVLSLDSQGSHWQLHQRISAEDSFRSSAASFNLPDPVWEFIAQTSLPDQQDGDEPTLLWWHYASCGVALASGVYLAKQTVADDDLVLSGGVIESSIAERHDLMVSVVDVDGATLGGQFEIAPDGSFDAILPRQSGVVIFVVSSASESSTSSSDFLSASLESPLEGSLYAMRVLESADSEANVTINLLSTWAFHLAQQRSESEGLPFDADLVESSYQSVANLMWLAGLERSESDQWIDYSEPTVLPEDELAPGEADRFVMVEQLLAKALMLREGHIDEFGVALAQSFQPSGESGEWRLTDEMANELIAAADAIGVNIVDWVSLALDHQPPELYFELPVTITADVPTTSWRDGGVVYLNSNEPISGLELSDFSVAGGRVTAVQEINAQRWKLTVEINSGFDGDAEISLAANALVDRGLNSNSEPLMLSVAADFLPAAVISASIYSNNVWSSSHATQGDRVTIDSTVDETLADLPMVRGLGVESNATQLSEGHYRWSALVNSDTSMGPVAIEINLVDSVGNTTVWNRPASLLSVEIDAALPQQTITTLTLENDSGVESGDLLTNVKEQSIQASLSQPLAAGERLQLKHNESGWQDISSSLTGALLNHPVILFDGDNQFSFRVADAANNLGPESQYLVELDQAAPEFVSQQLISSNDIANIAGLGDRITLTILADEPILLPENLLIAGDTAEMQRLADNSFSATVIVDDSFSNGPTEYEFALTDRAGNISLPSNQMATEIIVIDSSAPTALIQEIVLSSDSGSGSSDALTNTAEQTISARLSTVLEEGEQLQFSLNSQAWVTATASLAGDQLALPVTLREGVNQLAWRVVDGAGNIGRETQFAAELDTTPPAITAGSFALSADSGSSNSDHLTQTAEQNLLATLSAELATGDRLELQRDSGEWVDITGSVTGTEVSYPLTLNDGDNAFALRVVDAAGNLGAATSYNAELDTTASTIIAGSFALSRDSGSSNSDHLTQTAEQNLLATLSGELAIGDRLELQRDSGAWVDITSSVTGTVVNHTLTLNEGDNAFAMRVVDAAGNLGTATTHNAELDTSASSITAGSFALSADSGTSSSDHLTKTAEQNLLATLSAELATGDRLELQHDSDEWVDITSSVTDTAVSHALTLNEGDNAFALRVVDAAGNLGTAASYNAELDTTASTITTGSFALSADSGTSSSDHLTKTAEQNLLATLSGELATGDRLELQHDSDEWVDITSSVTGTAVNHALTLNEGDNAFAIRVVDAAGNLGTATTHNAELDTSASSITAGSFALSADSGTSSSDHLTKTAEQNLLATLSAELATGDRLELQRDSGEWADITGSVTGTEVSYPLTLNDGDNVFALRVVDAAGNLGTATTYNAELDTTQSAITAGSFALSADSGSSNSDHLTQTAEQNLLATLSAELATGDRLELQRDSGEWADITGSVTGTEVSYPLTLNDGDNAFALRVVDAAGNLGAATSYNAELDTTASTIIAGSFALSSDSGSSNSDHLTQTAEQNLLATLSSELAIGDRLELQRDSGAWVDITSSVTGDVVSHTLTLNDGDNAFAMRVVDAAGNLGNSTSYSAALDQVAPVVTNISIATTDGDTTAKLGDTVELLFSLNDSVPEPSVVTIDGTLVIPVLVSSSDGSYHYSASHTVVEGSSEGPVEFTVVATDNAGNISLSANATTDSSAVVIDTTAPNAGLLGFSDFEDSGRSAVDKMTSDTSYSLLVSGQESSASVTYYRSFDGASWHTTTQSQNTLAEGTYWYRASITDAAGNTSYTEPVNVTIDTTDPNQILVASGVTAQLTGADGVQDLIISSDRYGGLIAAWSQPGIVLANRDIYLQRFDNSGENATEAVTLSGSADYADYDPWLIAFDDGQWNLLYFYQDSSSERVITKQFSWQDLSLSASRATLAGAQNWRDFDALAGENSLILAVSNEAPITYNALQKIIATVGRDGVVLSQNVDSGTFMQLERLDNGSLAASWLSSYDVSRGGGFVTLEIFSPEGVSSGDLIPSGRQRTEVAPQIFALPNGVVAVGWQQSDELRLQRFSSDGSPLDSESIVIASASGGDGLREIVATGDDGSFALVWQSNYRVSLQWFDAAGVAQGEPVYSQRDTAIKNIQAVALDNGTFAVAWVGIVGADTPMASDRYAFVQRYDSSGNPLGELAALPTSGPNMLVELQLEALANGEFSLAWREYEGTVSQGAIVLFDANGVPVIDYGVELTVDSGRYDNDWVTDTQEQTITGQLSAGLATGEQLMASLDGGSSWANISSSVIGTAINWTTILPASGQFQLKIVDAAANESLLVDRVFNIDSTAPSQTISAIALSDDSGANTTDKITAVAEQTISATLSATLEPSDTLWGSVDNGNNWRPINDMVYGLSINWSQGSRLSGSSNILFKVVDLAGNEGSVASAVYQLDQTAPAIAATVFADFEDTGTAESGTPITSDTTFTLTAPDAEAGSVVTYQRALDADTLVWQEQSGAVSGLADGHYHFRATVTDTAGNYSITEPVEVVLDTQAPVVSVVSLTTTNSSTSAKTGDTVELRFTTNELISLDSPITIANQSVSISQLNSSGSESYYHIALYIVSDDSVEGSVAFSIEAKDYAGNSAESITSTSDETLVSIDNTAPEPGVLSFTDLTDTGSSSTDGVTSDNNFSLAIAGQEEGTTVEFQRSSDGTVWTATTAEQVDVAEQVDPYYYRALVVDAAGNQSFTKLLNVTIDISAPSTAAATQAIASGLPQTAELIALPGGGYLNVYSDDNPWLQRYDEGGNPVGDLTLLLNHAYDVTHVSLATVGDEFIGIAYILEHATGKQGLLELYNYQTNTTIYQRDWGGTGLSYRYVFSMVQTENGEVAVLRDYTRPSSQQSLLARYNTVGDLLGYVDLGDVAARAVQFSSDGEYAGVYTYRASGASANDSTLVLSSGDVQLTTGGSGTGHADLVIINDREELAIAYTVNNEMAVKIFSREGIALTTAVVSNVASTPSFSPEMIAFGNGAFALSWTTDDGLHLQIFTADGAASGARLDLQDNRDFTNVDMVVVGESRELLVGWYNTETELYTLRRFDQAGTEIGTPIVFDRQGLSLVALPGGEYAIAQVPTGDAAVSDFVMHFLADGSQALNSAVQLSRDSGRFDSDLITDTASQTITLELTAALAGNEDLLGSLDGGASWTNLNDQLTEKVLSWDVTLPASGTLQLKIVDSAGNETLLVNDPYSVDSSAPTVTVSAITLDEDTGSSSTDRITTVAQQTISATLSAELSASEMLYGSVDGGETWRLITDAVDGTAVSWSVGATLDGASSIQLKIVDVAGNEGAVASADYQLVASDVDTSVVVFDLVNGASSSHSDRIFDSNVEYSIYLLVDSDQSILNDSGSEWGIWSGGDNLSANDRVIIVGDTGAIDIADNYTYAGLADGDDLFAQTDQFGLKVGSNSTAEHLLLGSTGKLTRRMAYTSVASAQLWSGQAVFATPAAAAQYLSAIPDGLLTSQGLS